MGKAGTNTGKKEKNHPYLICIAYPVKNQGMLELIKYIAFQNTVE